MEGKLCIEINVIAWVGVGATRKFDGKEYKYKGENFQFSAHGYGVFMCISDPNITITGTFLENKPNGFCK